MTNQNKKPAGENALYNQMVVVIDFGGQYKQLIARRVRDLGIYCEVRSNKITADELAALNPSALILTGGPNSVYEENAPKMDSKIYEMGLPILGICYGAQLIAQQLGGRAEESAGGEYGSCVMSTNENFSPLFKGIPISSKCWMSHVDSVVDLPEGFRTTASTKDCPIAAFEHETRKIFAVQCHPEVQHTEHGGKILSNFLYEIAGLDPNWKIEDFVTQQIEECRRKVGDKKVLLGLSGGVDSSVVAALLHRAIGSQLTCIFVDHGLLRLNEAGDVESLFKNNYDMSIIRVDAESRFLSKLAGVSEPENKRKIIGEEFIRVFEEESKKLGKIEFLAQGTIYPDIVESGGDGHGAVIKSHHNVGGLPKDIGFEGIIEPLKYLFKDEVRRAGLELGLPKDVVERQPFPGPGLAVRVIGEITKEKLDILRQADAVFRQEIKSAQLAQNIAQYFAVLTDMRTVGVREGQRSYDYVLALRAVNTSDFMTAGWSKIPHDVLEHISTRISSEVTGISRIVYDITSKPPGSIEWE